MDFSKDELKEAKRQIDSVLHKLRETIKTFKAKENAERYKSQITLAKRRVKSFEIAKWLTCPRQHRHLKRKDSIRFLVSLVFSNFFIYTGCRKELAPNCRIRVKIYSKAARPLSNLSGVSGNTLPASDNRLLHGSVFGYKISICTQIPRSRLPPGCGNAVRLTIPVLTSPGSSPSAHCPGSSLSGSCC